MRYENKPFEESEELLTEVAEETEQHIILYNDDVNTFEHVIVEEPTGRVELILNLRRTASRA